MGEPPTALPLGLQDVAVTVDGAQVRGIVTATARDRNSMVNLVRDQDATETLALVALAQPAIALEDLLP